MSWAEDQAKRISDATDRAEKDRAWQLHIHKLVESEGPRVFEELAGRIERITADFNKASGGDRLQCERSGGALTITKPGSPAGSLRVSHAGSRVAIYQRIVRSAYDPVDQHEELKYTLDRNGVLLLDGTTDLEVVAQRLVARLIDLFL